MGRTCYGDMSELLLDIFNIFVNYFWNLSLNVNILSGHILIDQQHIHLS